MKRVIASAMAMLVPFGAILMTGCGGGDDAATATIGIRFSEFTNIALSAQVGQPITITLRNEDPIDHEWIVGTAAVHERH